MDDKRKTIVRVLGKGLATGIIMSSGWLGLVWCLGWLDIDLLYSFALPGLAVLLAGLVLRCREESAWSCAFWVMAAFCALFYPVFFGLGILPHSFLYGKGHSLPLSMPEYLRYAMFVSVLLIGLAGWIVWAVRRRRKPAAPVPRERRRLPIPLLLGRGLGHVLLFLIFTAAMLRRSDWTKQFTVWQKLLPHLILPPLWWMYSRRGARWGWSFVIGCVCSHAVWFLVSLSNQPAVQNLLALCNGGRYVDGYSYAMVLFDMLREEFAVAAGVRAITQFYWLQQIYSTNNPKGN